MDLIYYQLVYHAAAVHTLCLPHTGESAIAAGMEESVENIEAQLKATVEGKRQKGDLPPF